MEKIWSNSLQKVQIDRSIKTGLIRELFQRQQITRDQFEMLMRLQRT